MKHLFLTATLLTLVGTSSLAMAQVGENRNAPQLNPHAKSNQSIVKSEVALQEIKPATRLNSKEINPVFKNETQHKTGTGTGYSIRVQH